MMHHVKILLAAGILASLAGCGKTADKAAGKPPVAVETAAAKTAELINGIEVTGTLEPKFAVDVRTQIPGLVKQVLVNEWVRVHKGQPLARIDVAETEAQLKRAEAGIASAKAGLAQAGVALSRAERELERILRLKESGLATQQAVDDARTESEAARARVEAARAQARAAEAEVRQASARQAKGQVSAPIDGVVALRNVNVGDLASDAAAGKPIFRIVDNSLLNLTVTVSSADSARVKVGQPLEFRVDSLPKQTFTGKVMYVNPELSATDRSLKVIAEVRNIPETLKGGLFAKGRIITGRRANVLQVPRSALSSLDLATGKGALFVVESGVARHREIAANMASGEMLEVSAGLKPGEQYVLRGGFNLKDGDRVSTGAAGK